MPLEKNLTIFIAKLRNQETINWTTLRNLLQKVQVQRAVLNRLVIWKWQKVQIVFFSSVWKFHLWPYSFQYRFRNKFDKDDIFAFSFDLFLNRPYRRPRMRGSWSLSYRRECFEYSPHSAFSWWHGVSKNSWTGRLITAFIKCLYRGRYSYFVTWLDEES